MTRYAAFLRGINVGGSKVIQMDALAKSFAALGFAGVKTILASGNVVFEAPRANARTLTEKIEARLRKDFKTDISVVLRTRDALQALADSAPFKGIRVTPETRLYVTFLYDKPQTPFKIPPESPGKGYKLLRATDGEVCSVLTVSPEHKSTDLMTFLDKTFGKKVTTRNWNTLAKVLSA